MEKRDKTGIKTWWSGRHLEKKRIGNYCHCKEWTQSGKKTWKTKLTTRIQLYEMLVKSILLYNCGTWGASKDELRKLNNFRRRQLRKVIRIQWPHKNSNNKLYKITGTNQLSITIIKRRWKRLGHILRLPANFPARIAIRYYLEERTNKIFRGRRRTTIVSTLNEGVKQTKGDDMTYPVTPLVSQSQSTESLHQGQEQKTLVKDCAASCKISQFQKIKMNHASFLIM